MKVLKSLLKDIFSDNYNVCTLIVSICLLSPILTDIYELIRDGRVWEDNIEELFTEFYYYIDLGEAYIIIYWILFVFAIWSIVREYNINSKSLWILFYGAIAIIYNPIKTIQIDGTISHFIVLATLFIVLREIIFSKKAHMKIVKLLKTILHNNTHIY